MKYIYLIQRLFIILFFLIFVFSNRGYCQNGVVPPGLTLELKNKKKATEILPVNKRKEAKANKRVEYGIK